VRLVSQFQNSIHKETYSFPVPFPVTVEEGEPPLNGTPKFGGTDEIQLATEYAVEGAGTDKVLKVDHDDEQV
jgi:hypothetical protein